MRAWASPAAVAFSRRIVIVNRYFSPDQSATSQLSGDLTLALADRGFNVHVICSRQRSDDAKARLAADELIGGVAVHRVWTTRFGRGHLLWRAVDYMTFYASSFLEMLRLLRRGDILIAETDPPLLSIVASIATRLKGALLVNWLQDIFPEAAAALGAYPAPRALDRLLRRCRDHSLQTAHLNIVIGGRMRERLLQLGVAPSKIQLIENWSVTTHEDPIPVDQSLLRRSLGLHEKFVVGYSGNLGRAHDYETLLQAAHVVAEDGEIVFLMIGAGAGMVKLQRAVLEHGLTNFLFLAHQPAASLSDSLAAADVHWLSLLPVLEGLIVPSKFYGILAAARPAVFIGDPQGEIAAIIRASDCGCSVSIGDVAALVYAVRRLQTDAPLRAHMSQQGYRQYRERYSARRALAAWSSVIESLLPVEQVNP